MSTCCLIFLRYPEAGKAKTRLIPALGAVGAARLYRLMAEHVCALCHRADMKMIAYVTANADVASAQEWLGEHIEIRKQSEGDLGQKLRTAFEDMFSAGFSRVIAIGSDCVTLSEHELSEAENLLERSDVVIGPSSDGGYYLIGMSRFLPAVFYNIPWSTETTRAATEEQIRSIGAHCSYLSERSDVDTPDDLALLPEQWQARARDCKDAHSIW